MARRKLNLYPRVALPKSAPALKDESLQSLRALMALWARLDVPAPETLEALREGRFTFLNRSEDLSSPPAWARPDLPRLWSYHLHYFDYVRTFALANTGRQDENDRRLVLSWIHDWIAMNPPGTAVAWDAFPIAARLTNWALAEAVFRFDDPLLRRSMEQQAEYLRRSLEWDSLANHLLRDAVGLCVAGSLLGGKALRRGLAILEHEINEQILPDGGHYERSPMYHCQVLQDLLIVHAALDVKPAFLRHAIARMAAFLEAILHPDGDIPLLGDAALGAYRPQALLAAAKANAGWDATPRPAGPYALEPSGFYLLADPDTRLHLIVRGGAPGPDYQLAHAHCDLLSYELSVGGTRIIVDSGVHGYAESPLREYCRSTRAHNTFCVNGREQMECWATFRVGRRAKTSVPVWDAESGEFRAALHVPDCGEQERSITSSSLGCLVIHDRAQEQGELRLESFIHFHPECSLRECEGAWIAERAGVRVGLLPLTEVEASLVTGEEDPAQGWYCPEFGKAIPAPVLVLKHTCARVAAIAYAIFPGGLPDNCKELAGMLATPQRKEVY